MNNEELLFTRKSSGLVKGLSWIDIFIIVISAPAGSGILYYSVSAAASYPGGNVGLSFLIGLLIFLPVIYLASISADLIPRSGSLYVFISRTIHPSVGFLSASLFFLGYTLTIGVIAFIVVNVVGGILVSYGVLADIGILKSIGSFLQNKYISTVGGCMIVFLTWGIVLRGVRMFKIVMHVLFYITILSVIVSIGYFFFTENIPFSFDTVWGNEKYQQIIDLATQNGWGAPSFSWQSTLNLLLVVMFSYGGLELISYSSGEISTQRKKNLRAYIFAGLMLGLIYIAISFSVKYAFGDFISAYSYLYSNYQKELETIFIPIAPSIPFYITSVIPNPWIGIPLSIGLTFWLVNTLIPYFFAPSRIIFAFAMDRIVPENMANVSRKRGAPTNASHLTLVFALLGVFFNLFNVGTVLGTILFSALFVYWLYGLSAMLLPYTNPVLFERCILKKSLFTIPLLSWLGGLVFLIGWFVIFISAKQMTFGISITLCGLMAGSMIYYVARLGILKNRGINAHETFTQLPPD